MKTIAAVIFCLLLSGLAHGVEWPTLRQELRVHGIEVTDFEDADRQISSYAVQVESDWFAVAYYWHQENGLLPHELRIRTLNRQTGVWRHRVFDRGALRGGSVLRLARHRSWIYVDLHVNPSAGSLIVLSEDLRLNRRLYGWTELVLQDGRVVYHDSMVHFAPFHAATIGLYDPRTGRDTRLYPERPDDAPATRPVNRTILEVAQTGTDQIMIRAREQELTWTSSTETASVGPERDHIATCTLSGVAPKCTVRSADVEEKGGAVGSPATR